MEFFYFALFIVYQRMPRAPPFFWKVIIIRKLLLLKIMMKNIFQDIFLDQFLTESSIFVFSNWLFFILQVYFLLYNKNNIHMNWWELFCNFSSGKIKNFDGDFWIRYSQINQKILSYDYFFKFSIFEFRI